MRLPLPPTDVSAARLFRLLSHPDCPRLDISYRVRGAEHLALHVRAPLARGIATALDQQGATPEATIAIQRRALIAEALWAGGARAFCDLALVDKLLPLEFSALFAQVDAALAIISPRNGWCDAEAWFTKLRFGADDVHNQGQAVAMASTRETHFVPGEKPIRVERPDLYYGKPVAALTDGQRWAYQAGCDATDN